MRSTLKQSPVPPATSTVGRTVSMSSQNIGSHARELASALVVRNKPRALAVLVRAGTDGWELREVEEHIIAPAVTRLGQLWLRGRLDDSTFSQAGALAEAVERAFRRVLFVESRVNPRRGRATSGPA